MNGKLDGKFREEVRGNFNKITNDLISVKEESKECNNDLKNINNDLKRIFDKLT